MRAINFEHMPPHTHTHTHARAHTPKLGLRRHGERDPDLELFEAGDDHRELERQRLGNDSLNCLSIRPRVLELECTVVDYDECPLIVE
jgi:hypothetical protein